MSSAPNSAVSPIGLRHSARNQIRPASIVLSEIRPSEWLVKWVIRYAEQDQPAPQTHGADPCLAGPVAAHGEKGNSSDGGIESVRSTSPCAPDAEQAHRAAACFGAIEQRQRAHHDLVLVAGRNLRRVVARNRSEVCIAHLDGHGARAQVLANEHRCGLAGEALDLARGSRPDRRDPPHRSSRRSAISTAGRGPRGADRRRATRRCNPSAPGCRPRGATVPRPPCARRRGARRRPRAIFSQ